jgi:dipeptidyl aminopeptidase/acylaminoacyl peptidase
MLPGSKFALVSIRVSRADIAESRIGVVDLSTGAIDTIGMGARADYSSGYLIFSTADNTLQVQPFDVKSRKTDGPSAVLISALALDGGVSHQFSASSNDWLSYSPGIQTGEEILRVWSPDGRGVLQLPAHAGDEIEDLAIAPDGRHVMLRLYSAANAVSDLWLFDKQQGTLQRFTVGGGSAPAWSRDGRSIAYTARGDSSQSGGIYSRASNLSGSTRLLLPMANAYAGSWSPDGRSLVFMARRKDTGEDIGMLTVGDSTVRWLLDSEFNERHPQLSPDGIRLSFTSQRSGAWEVYVRRLSGEIADVQISTGGGNSARWLPDGSGIAYYTSAGVTVATLMPGTVVEVQSRRVLIGEDGPNDMNAENVNWDVFPDGQRVLFMGRSTTGKPRIALLQHWVELAHSLGAKR